MADSLPHSRSSHRLTGRSFPFQLDRLLTLSAIGVVLFAAYWPIFGEPIGQPAQSMALMIVAVVAIGGWLAPRGSRLALSLLWAGAGMAFAFGTIAIFSVGLIVVAAAVLILLAIPATPNRSGLELRFHPRFIAAFFAGYLFLFVAVFLPI